MTKFSKVLGAFTALPFLGAGVAAIADDESNARAERREEIVKRYDADGDGRLSRGELGTAREARTLERRRPDGDRTLSHEERAAGSEARGDRRGRHRRERRSRFDTNGDGVVGQEERGAVYEDRKLEGEIMLERHGADGGGHSSDFERESIRVDGGRQGRPGGARSSGGGRLETSGRPDGGFPDDVHDGSR